MSNDASHTPATDVKASRRKTTSTCTKPKQLAKKPFLKQGTTWAGILSVGMAFATGGLSVLTDPVLLSQVGAGLALLVAEN